MDKTSTLNSQISAAIKGLIFCTLLIACSNAQAVIRFNEIFYGPENPEDGRQFVELYSTTGGAESVENLWILEIDGDTEAGLSDNAGEVLTAMQLGAATPGIDTTGSNGLFLWRDSSTVLDTSITSGVQGPDSGTTVFVNDYFPGREDLGYEFPPPNETENNVPTFLLVENFNGSLNQDLDTNNDGVFETFPWDNVVDSISWNEVGDPGFLYAEQFGGSSQTFQGDFGADVASFDPIEDMWAFYDSGSGEDNASYVGPFFANDGFGWISPAGSNALFIDGRRIVVGSDSKFIYATPGTENISAIGGLNRGDTDHDGDVDADDIDLLYDNLGVVGTTFDIAANFGPAGQADVDYLVQTVLNTEYGDANLDGVIDEQDYDAWVAGYGADSGWAGGDFQGDQISDAADYTIWRDNLGFGASSISSATSVPEPSSLFAMGISLFFASSFLSTKRMN